MTLYDLLDKICVADTNADRKAIARLILDLVAAHVTTEEKPNLPSWVRALDHYPKVFRNPTVSLVPTDRFTVQQPTGEFLAPPVLVGNATEEAIAIGNGFTEEIPAHKIPRNGAGGGLAGLDATAGGIFAELRATLTNDEMKAGTAALAIFPKTFRNPETGADVIVANGVEQEKARTEGFTMQVLPIVPVPVVAKEEEHPLLAAKLTPKEKADLAKDNKK